MEYELRKLRAKDSPDLNERKRIPKLFGDIEKLRRMQQSISLRGGCWGDDPGGLHSARRMFSGSHVLAASIGFLLAMTL
jgi:hypothetical protein